MAKNNATDVNTEIDSSTVSNGDETERTSSGAKTSSEETENSPSLSDLVGTALEKNAEVEEEEESSTSTEREEPENNEDQEKEGDEKSRSKTEQDEEEPKEKVEGEEEEPKTEEEDEEKNKGPVPYERFHEVVEQKNEFEGKIKEYEPIVQAHQSIVDFCQENKVQPDQFQQALQFLAAMNRGDVEAAQKLIGPTLEALQSFTGDRLPKDLQDAVDNEEISLDYARRLAKAEAQKQLGERRSQLTQEEVQQREQARVVKTIQTSLETWDVAKRKRDPDFRPKKSAEADDGKYEWFMDKMARLIQATPPRTPEEAIKLAEKALADVDKAYTRFAPAKGKKKSLTSTRSSQTDRNNHEPKSLMEVVRNRLEEESEE